ncbi:MAG: Crp/Fnr family transcriptional regulator [Methanoregulaceae archaeon]|nr:Crp/Fnr family transcriptional regulator [Methanoregulaceae archaeon]
MSAEQAALANGQERPDKLESLLACSLCDGIPQRLAAHIVSRCRLEHAARGETVWSAGVDSRFFAIVADGIIRLSRRSVQGREITVEVLGPGSCAGILATLAGTRYPLTATAITDSWYLKVPRELWGELRDGHDDFRERALAEMGRRLLHGFDFMSALLAGDVEQRLATAVLRVHDLLESRSGNVLPVTRQHLAEIASVTVESAIRVTSRWQQRGWIDSGYRHLTLKDTAALRDLLTHSPRASRA